MNDKSIIKAYEARTNNIKSRQATFLYPYFIFLLTNCHGRTRPPGRNPARFGFDDGCTEFCGGDCV
jgi:hypothetical protein